MKKVLIILAVVVLAVILGWVYFMPKDGDTDVSASQVSALDEKASGALVEKDADSDYRVFASVHGDVKIPKDPQRIVVLSTSSSMGSILQFGADKVVGHEKWSSYSPLFAPLLKNSTLVDAENLEQIMALKPDLIIVNPQSKNLAEFSKIAPTLESFTRDHYDYLDAVIEYADLVNKKAEAEAWVKNFKARSDKVGAKLKSKYGEDVSVSVMDVYGDELYLYGDNWGRGTQILYRQMGLKMPDAVKNVALEKGYYSISTEVLPKYAGDLMILVHYNGSNLAFMETETWKNLPALKAGNVMIVENGEGFYHADSMTLTHQLNLIEKHFLQDASASQVSAPDEKATGALAEKDAEAKSEFRAFPSVGGEVMIPKDPKRIFVAIQLYVGEFAQYAPDKIVGFELHPMFKNDAKFMEVLKNAKSTNPNNIEEIMALKPDLIYSSTFTKNNAELAKIAPTIIDEVSNTKDYFARNIEIATIVNKADEAKKWVADFTKRAKEVAEKLRKKHGENISASVFFTMGDNFYYLVPYGTRGAYLLNHVMGIPMPKTSKLPEDLKKRLAARGSAPISVEVLPEVAGDLILICSYAGSSNSFMQTETWKNLPAVKKGNYLVTGCEKFTYVDGASMEFKLKTIEDAFLKAAKK